MMELVTMHDSFSKSNDTSGRYGESCGYNAQRPDHSPKPERSFHCTAFLVVDFTCEVTEMIFGDDAWKLTSTEFSTAQCVY